MKHFFSQKEANLKGYDTKRGECFCGSMPVENTSASCYNSDTAFPWNKRLQPPVCTPVPEGKASY